MNDLQQLRVESRISEILTNLENAVESSTVSRINGRTSNNRMVHGKFVDEIMQSITTTIEAEVVSEQQEILKFATRVQSNGQFVPIEAGLIPWLEQRLQAAQQQPSEDKEVI